MSMILDPSGRPAEVAMTPREHPLAPRTQEPARLTRIVRSRSFKMNLGDYQSMDFFCSIDGECDLSAIDETCEALDEKCYEEILKSVRKVQAARAKKESQRERSAA